MTVAFDYPTALALLPLVLLGTLLPVLARRLRGYRPARRSAVLLLRGTLLAALVLALAGPYLAQPRQARTVVFALDISESMGEAVQARAREWIAGARETLGPESQVALVEFAGRATLSSDDAAPRDDRGETNLEDAVRFASTLATGRPSPEVVVIGDGWQNRGDATRVPGGVAVSYVAPAALGPLTPEVSVARIALPPAVRVGDSLAVTATVHSSAVSQVGLRVQADGAAPVERSVVLQPGSNQVSVPVRVRAEGFVTVQVQVVPPANADTLAANNTLQSVVIAKPAGRALVLEGEEGVGTLVAAALEREGIPVQRRPARTVPPSAATLMAEGIDTVFLVNTPATGLTLDQQRTLQQFVRDHGRGLVLVGGPLAFAPGGYEDTVLDEMLPISAKPPPEPRKGAVALVIVLDRSGSMALKRDGVSKLQMAKEAASQAAGLLKPGDTLGVLAFESTFDWVVPTAVLQDEAAIQNAQALIATIRDSGGTSIYPALEKGYRSAIATDARLKHVVLLTDGQDTVTGYEQLIQAMRPQGVTLSAVAVGSDADTRLLSTLAGLGGGRYYFTERPTQIPTIAAKETSILTNSGVIDGEVAANVREPSPLLRGLPGDLPLLSGYVAATPKDRAVTALESERGHPLLAHWQYGLGRVVAWTSDGGGDWASRWPAWQGGSRLWAQAAWWSMPAPDAPGLRAEARLDTSGRRVALRAETVADTNRLPELADTRATIVGPDGTAREIEVPARAPGVYERTLEVDQPGVYRVLVTQRTPTGSTVREETTGFAIPSAPELRTVGFNTPLLESLAQGSGGRVLQSPSDLLQPPPNAPATAAPIGEKRTPIWPWLLGLAVVLLPLDVALRRLRFGRSG